MKGVLNTNGFEISVQLVFFGLHEIMQKHVTEHVKQCETALSIAEKIEANEISFDKT